MPKSTTQEWQRGLTLWHAIEKYAPKQIWNEYVVLGADLSPSYSEEFIIQPGVSSEPMPLAEDPVRTFERKARRFQILERILKLCAVKQLREETYLALAYRSPRFRDAKPEWISANYWSSGRVAWSTSELLAGDIIYTDLRILPARQPQAPKPSKSGKRYPAPGRPSLNDTIKAAYDALAAAGSIPRNKPINAIFPSLRKKVRELDPETTPDASGLGDSKLYDFFLQLKKKEKTAKQ